MARQIADVKNADNDLGELLAQWARSLKAQRKAPGTLKNYLAGPESLASWCAAEGRPFVLDADTVEAWTIGLLDASRTANTIIARQAAVRRFSRWLADKKLIEADRLGQVRPPKRDDPLVPALDDAELRKLLATCKGAGFSQVRDRALITFMAETTARAAEVIAMELPDDLNLDAGVGIVRRGKGGKGRLVPFSPQCGERIDDYLRLRRKHRLAKAGSRALWLGTGGRTFGYAGLHRMISRRAETAGLPHVHPHQLRHTAATRWLDRGGSTTGLLAVGGWSSIDMLRRYIRASEGRLAAEEARRLDLGDI